MKKNTSTSTLSGRNTALVFLLVLCIAATFFAAGCMSSGPAGTANPAKNTIVQTPVSLKVTPSATGTPGVIPGVTASTESSPENTSPCRIVVTNGDAAELLVAIGAKECVVGVSDTVKTDPVLGPLFSNVESVGNWQTPNPEKILSLNASTVVSYASYQPKNLDQLKAANISLLNLDCYKLESLASDARTLGKLTGHESGAEKYVSFLNGYLDRVGSAADSLKESEKPRVYFESYSDYSAQSGGTGSDNLILMAGGENIAADIPVSSPKVNAEWVVSQNPDVILKVASPSKNSTEIARTWELITNRTGMDTVTAVKSGRIYILNSDLAYGPRAFTGLLYTAKIMHPDTFRDIDPEEALDRYAREFVPGANQTYTVYPAFP